MRILQVTWLEYKKDRLLMPGQCVPLNHGVHLSCARAPVWGDQFVMTDSGSQRPLRRAEVELAISDSEHEDAVVSSSGKAAVNYYAHQMLGSLGGRIAIHPPAGSFPLVAFDDVLPSNHPWFIRRKREDLSVLDWVRLTQNWTPAAELDEVAPRPFSLVLMQRVKKNGESFLDVTTRADKQFKILKSPISFTPGAAWNSPTYDNVTGLAAAMRSELAPNGELYIGMQIHDGRPPELDLCEKTAAGDGHKIFTWFEINQSMTRLEPSKLWRYVEPSWSVIERALETGSFD